MQGRFWGLGRDSREVGLTAAVFAAIGGLAIGSLAVGGAAIGGVAVGGGGAAVGKHAFSPLGQDPEAAEFFGRYGLDKVCRGR